MDTLTNKLDYITSIIKQIESKEDLKNFLNDILTPSEIETIYERLQIIKLLKKWLTQREVALKLNTSTSTVNRWSRILKYGSWILKTLKL